MESYCSQSAVVVSVIVIFTVPLNVKFQVKLYKDIYVLNCWAEFVETWVDDRHRSKNAYCMSRSVSDFAWWAFPLIFSISGMHKWYAYLIPRQSVYTGPKFY